MKIFKYNKYSKKMIVINLVLLFGFLIFLIIRFHSIIEKKNDLEISIDKEYKTLLTKDSINSVVASTFYPEDWRGGDVIQNITFANGQKYSIYIRRKLFDENISFGTIVKEKEGVLIMKHRGSDTLVVKLKNGKEYRFLIVSDNF